MKPFFKKLLERVEKEELELKLETPDLIIRESHRMILFLMSVLSEFKKEVINHDFLCEVEEIEFFKVIKPDITSRLIFYNEIFHLETSRPVSNGKVLKSYYKKVLKKTLKKCSNNHRSDTFYQYIRANRTDKDTLFFVRKNLDSTYNSEIFFLRLTLYLRHIMIIN